MDPLSSNRDKITAIKELRTSSKDLFDKMFDAGVFKRKLGEIEVGKELSQEEQDLINRVIKLDYGTKKSNRDKTRDDIKRTSNTTKQNKSE